MINKHYRDSAIEVYREACEICGYKVVEVHHINYQEQQDIERKLRKAKGEELINLSKKAREMGFDYFDGRQLSKDDSASNLAVLCGNCHSLIHTMDVGMKLKKVLAPRK